MKPTAVSVLLFRAAFFCVPAAGAAPRYADIAPVPGGFAAAGNGLSSVDLKGRASLIFPGALLGVASQGGRVMAVGGSERVLLLERGQVSQLALPAGMPALRCIASDGKRWIAGTADGRLYALYPDGTSVTAAALPVRVPGGGLCDLLYAQGRLFAACSDAEHGCRLFFTGDFRSWNERDLTVYGQEGPQRFDRAVVVSLCASDDQVLAVLADGRVLTLSGCEKCNKVTRLSGSALTAASVSERRLLAADPAGRLHLRPTEAFRQERMRWEAAAAQLKNGAALIDLRDAADFEAEHIPGSFRLAPADLAAELPKRCPDRYQTLIFCCYSGKRSGEALEAARKLGYDSVYNLGGYRNWKGPMAGHRKDCAGKQ